MVLDGEPKHANLAMPATAFATVDGTILSLYLLQ